MPLRELSRFQQRPDGYRQLEQADEVCDGGAVLPHGLGDVGVLHVEALGEGLVPLGLLERIQGLSLKVFHERQNEKRLVIGVAHDDRYLRPVESTECAITSLARHQLKTIRGTARGARPGAAEVRSPGSTR